MVKEENVKGKHDKRGEVRGAEGIVGGERRIPLQCI